MEILAQLSADFALKYNFQGTHIWAHRAVIFAIAWLLINLDLNTDNNVTVDDNRKQTVPSCRQNNVSTDSISKSN